MRFDSEPSLYKYKNYKFLKSEGLIGAVPVQRMPLKLHDRSPFKPAVHYEFPDNFIN